MNNGDMPASPQSAAIGPSGDVYDSESNGGTGLTKREQFAAMAMQGLMVNLGRNGYSLDEYPETMAKDCLKAADALLQELDK